MSNTTGEVRNVHDDKVQEEYQANLDGKAKALVALLKEEPEARLVPTLQVTERGIIPDVRLVLTGEVKEDEDESDIDAGAEDTSEGDDGESVEETTATESTEA